MCATLLRASIEKTFGSRHAVCLWGRSYSRRRPPYSLFAALSMRVCLVCVCSGYLYFFIFFRKKRNKDKNRGNVSNRLKWANQKGPDEIITCPLRRFIMLHHGGAEWSSISVHSLTCRLILICTVNTLPAKIPFIISMGTQTT